MLSQHKKKLVQQNLKENSILPKTGQNRPRIDQKCCFLHFLKNVVISFTW